jgi:DNA-binding PadR family transcriptional regulator
VEPSLDRLDIQLLKTLAVLGEIGHKNIDQQQRLTRLEVEGYVESVRHDPPALNAPPAWNYRLTARGQAALNS